LSGATTAKRFGSSGGKLVKLLEIEPFIGMLCLHMAHKRINDDRPVSPLCHEATVDPQFFTADRKRHGAPPMGNGVSSESTFIEKINDESFRLPEDCQMPVGYTGWFTGEDPNVFRVRPLRFNVNGYFLYPLLILKTLIEAGGYLIWTRGIFSCRGAAESQKKAN
jgi:hypothetical protein